MKLSFTALILILVANIFGLYFGWYHFGWFEMVLHGLGGFFVARIGWHIFGKSFEKQGLASLTSIVGFALLIGILWEGAEYLASQTLVEPVYEYFKIRAYFIGDLRDSMIDFGMDALGGFVYALTTWVWREKLS